ncbi:MAG: sulfurtransferase TusA family protein [Candidatus Eisenbacteria bacterium]|uniref:Sulfurtransferase TusA family protein n=1 Tax=Eiseniibacteriota bacterium TaxID=2212470 RepID=A0A7Y2E8J5_UNCEI|nr:sulfurtransferase TusA family protein [Candidatus Eisenbacteria bacterium]
MKTKASLDVLGKLCPIPIIKLAERMKVMEPGDTVTLVADDPLIVVDLPAWCDGHGQELVRLEKTGDHYVGLVRKTA